VDHPSQRGVHTLKRHETRATRIGRRVREVVGNVFTFLFAIFILVPLVVGMTYYVSGLVRGAFDPPQAQASTASQVVTTQKVARFTPHDAGAPPLALDLVGGNYDVTYEQSPSLPIAGGANVFIADFRRGTTQGDLAHADTVVLIGNVDLSVSDIRKDDRMNVAILTQGDTIPGAHFKLATDSTQPPRKRRVIVVGALYEVQMGAAHERSSRDVLVLEQEWTLHRSGIPSPAGMPSVADLVKERVGNGARIEGR
jgi:hypothetical protein